MPGAKELHVVFGTGPLGLATARALLARGRKVRLVNRSGKASALAGAELVRGDAYSPANVRDICTGATAVYQCAQPLYHKWPELFPKLQSSIIEGVAATGAKLIVAENLYMYGEVSGPIHEALPFKAHTRKGVTRARMAEELVSAHRSGKLRTASGRGSDFFGPEVQNSLFGEQVFVPALAGKATMALGNPELPHTYTYIEDFGEALAVLGEHDQALGQAWHVPNPPTLTTQEVLQMVFAEAGTALRVRRMGRLMLRLGGLFIPEARETVEMLYEFEQPFVVDSSRYVRAFGNHATPWSEAIQRTIAWYRGHQAMTEALRS